ncbi:hypothetical protein WHU42_17195 [Escherichia coli]
MDAMLQVIVDVIPKEDDVYVAVRVKNNGEIPLYIDVRYISQGKYPSSNQLSVECDGKKIRYSGVMYNLGQGEYYKISPGEMKVGDYVQIARDYHITPGKHECSFYTNVWSTVDSKVTEDDRDADFYNFKSNVVNLELNNPNYAKIFLRNH